MSLEVTAHLVLGIDRVAEHLMAGPLHAQLLLEVQAVVVAEVLIPHLVGVFFARDFLDDVKEQAVEVPVIHAHRCLLWHDVDGHFALHGRAHLVHCVMGGRIGRCGTLCHLLVIHDGYGAAVITEVATAAVHPFWIRTDEPLQDALLGQRRLQPGLGTVHLHQHQHLLPPMINGKLLFCRPIRFAANLAIRDVGHAFLVQHQPVMLAAGPTYNLLSNLQCQFTRVCHINIKSLRSKI